MFDDFHIEHDIKLFAFIGQHFRRAATIVDFKSGLCCMHLGDFDVVFRSIDRGHFCPHPCQRLGQQARTTSDIDDFDIFKRFDLCGVTPDMGTDIVPQKLQAHRVEAVQRFHHAIRIPPFFCHRGKTRDFLGIGGAAGFGGCVRHGVAPKA